MQTKTIRVKNGSITISVSPKFIKDIKVFGQLYQNESNKCLIKSQEVGGQEVGYQE